MAGCMGVILEDIMRYFKTVDNGYITSIGVGGGGAEITNIEFDDILSVIRNKPPRTSTTDYRLKPNLTWEEYERIDPDPEPETPENLFDAARVLLNEELIELPKAEEPDYFGEQEPEPDYFA